MEMRLQDQQNGIWIHDRQTRTVFLSNLKRISKGTWEASLLCAAHCFSVTWRPFQSCWHLSEAIPQRFAGVAISGLLSLCKEHGKGETPK